MLDSRIRQVADDQPGTRGRRVDSCIAKSHAGAVKKPLREPIQSLGTLDTVGKCSRVENLFETRYVSAAVADDVLDARPWR